MHPPPCPRRLGPVDREGLPLARRLPGAPGQQHRRAAQAAGRDARRVELCSEDQVVECLAAEYGVPYAKLDARLLDLKIVDVLPRDTSRTTWCCRCSWSAARSRSPCRAVEPVPHRRDPQPGTMEVQIVAATAKDIRRLITALPNSKVFVIDDIIEDSENADVSSSRKPSRTSATSRRSPASRR